MADEKTLERSDIEINGTLDIETEGWTQFVIGGGYFDGQYEDYDFHREGDFIDRILNFEGRIAAWNCGRYDSLLVLQHILDRKEKCRPYLAGSSIARLVVRKCEIWDAFRLVPLSLDTASSIVGQLKIKTGLPCFCGKWSDFSIENRREMARRLREAGADFGNEISVGCGGYCSIKRDMPPEYWDLIKLYLRNDNKLVWDIVQRVRRIAFEQDLDLKATVGSSAYRTMSRRLNIPKANWKNNRVSESTLYKFLHGGYFGGRTQGFNPLPDRIVNRRDINAAYPASLARLSLPTGERIECFNKAALEAFRSGKEGIYRARVHVPKMFVPPLPYRTRPGGRINFPYGTITGTWPANELRYAQSIGCDVQDVSHAVIWMDSQPIFRDYIDQIFDLRREAKRKGDKGTDQYLKFNQNSPIGKFGQRPECEDFVVYPDDIEEKACIGGNDCDGGRLCVKRSGMCCKHGCKGACGRYMPLDPKQRIWSKMIYRIPDCAHVHWGAYVMADTRIVLHKKIVSDGEGGRLSVMCDTDCDYSLIAKESGDGLGEWKNEGTCFDFIMLAPKTYSYIDCETGEFIARSKGIPKAAQNFHRLMEGVDINTGVLTFKAAASARRILGFDPPIFRRKYMRRQVRDAGGWFGDRYLGEDKLTYPTEINNLRPE